MITHPALILSVLKNATADRLRKAVTALDDHTLTVALTRLQTGEIRALVKNSDGAEYGVTITETLTACSCKDALYRGGICKHAVAVALFALRQPEPEQTIPVTVAPQFPTFHLAWKDGLVLCGDPHAERIQPYPWTEAMMSWPEVCTDCVQSFNHPKPVLPPPDLSLAKTRPGWGFAA